MTRTRSELITLFAICTILVLGCQNEKCQIDFVKFNSSSAPFICIDSAKAGCTFFFHGHFWLNKKNFVSSGELAFAENSIYLQIDSLGSAKVKYFDFSKEIADQYTIKFDLLDSSVDLNALVEKRINTNDDLIFVFRIKKAFFVDDQIGDLVYFVSRKKGIVGSYISDFESEVELVIAPRGDIMRNYIDYGSKSFRKIQ